MSNLASHLIFDFFGTLAHYSPSRTEQGYARSFEFLRSTGCTLDYDGFLLLWTRVADEFEARAARTHREFSMLELGEEFLFRAHARDPKSAARPFTETYLSEWNTGVRAIHDLPEMLGRLSAVYSCSIITNTHDPRLVPDHLDRMGISMHFDHVITSVELGIRKPSPKIFEHTLELLGVEPSACIYVGDDYEADYVGATSTGIPCLLIDPRREFEIDSTHRLETIIDPEGHLAK